MQNETQNWIVYQPLIVGLGAVVLGLIANSVLEWFKQGLSRKNDSKSLRSALIAELSANLYNLHGRLPERNERSSSGTLMVPMNSHVKVYDTAINRLGLLTEDQITRVITCYDYIINGPKNLAILGEIEGNTEYRWIKLSTKHLETIENMDKKSAEMIELAIISLRS